jgi:hypothetical protein
VVEHPRRYGKEFVGGDVLLADIVSQGLDQVLGQRYDSVLVAFAFPDIDEAVYYVAGPEIQKFSLPHPGKGKH